MIRWQICWVLVKFTSDSPWRARCIVYSNWVRHTGALHTELFGEVIHRARDNSAIRCQQWIMNALNVNRWSENSSPPNSTRPMSRLVLNAITHFEVYVQTVFALASRISQWIHSGNKTTINMQTKICVRKDGAEQVESYIILCVVDIDFYCNT